MIISLLDNKNSYSITVSFVAPNIVNKDSISNTITISNQRSTESASIINSILTINDAQLPNIVVNYYE
jgi:hypothetical protein